MKIVIVGSEWEGKQGLLSPCSGMKIMIAGSDWKGRRDLLRPCTGMKIAMAATVGGTGGEVYSVHAPE
ncbi:hypothetical protein EGT74_22635 [Chitinophaga lutea]|uniref:Uncharacterized protein n=1 Tax=Chitinophaga lutea TaxID=2488634 RepID=A0A3N4Q1D6_9BACT|nr:hypothetical protein EGT74_22635 [Chitinophaga lutea]